MKYPMFERILWTFDTAQFRVVLHVEEDDTNPRDNFQYKRDADYAREGGSHWFIAFVSIWRGEDENDLEYVAHDVLGGCSYASFKEFYTAHRDKDPMNRNCTIMRAKRGNVVICHYFPSMVMEATGAARRRLKMKPAA